MATEQLALRNTGRPPTTLVAHKANRSEDCLDKIRENKRRRLRSFISLPFTKRTGRRCLGNILAPKSNRCWLKDIIAYMMIVSPILSRFCNPIVADLGGCAGFCGSCMVAVSHRRRTCYPAAIYTSDRGYDSER